MSPGSVAAKSGSAAGARAGWEAAAAANTTSGRPPGRAASPGDAADIDTDRGGRPGARVPLGGAAWLERLLRRNAAIAAAHGHPARAEVMEGLYLPYLRGTPHATSSMSRDLEAGRRIEADHVLGFLLEAARRAGVPDELHEAAYIHAKAYEARRDAGRLPGA